MAESHPAWVCGLKHSYICNIERCGKSHPAWVCGLKLAELKAEGLLASHTLRGCVD